jgi:hypothetical protein
VLISRIRSIGFDSNTPYKYRVYFRLYSNEKVEGNSQLVSNGKSHKIDFKVCVYIRVELSSFNSTERELQDF